MTDAKNVAGQAPAKSTVDQIKMNIPALLAQADKAVEAGYMVDVLIEHRNNAMNLAANMQTQANIKAAQVINLQAELAKLKESNAQLQTALHDSSLHNQTMKIRLEENSAQIAQLQKSNGQLTTRLQESQTTRGSLEEELCEAKAKLSRFTPAAKKPVKTKNTTTRKKWLLLDWQ